MQLSGSPGSHGHTGSCSPRQFGEGESAGAAAEHGEGVCSPFQAGVGGLSVPELCRHEGGLLQLGRSCGAHFNSRPFSEGLLGPPSLLFPHNRQHPTPFPLCPAASCSPQAGHGPCELLEGLLESPFFLCWAPWIFWLADSHGGEGPSLQWPFPGALQTEGRGPLYGANRGTEAQAGLFPSHCIPPRRRVLGWGHKGVGRQPYWGPECGVAAIRALEVGGLNEAGSTHGLLLPPQPLKYLFRLPLKGPSLPPQPCLSWLLQGPNRQCWLQPWEPFKEGVSLIDPFLGGGLTFACSFNFQRTDQHFLLSWDFSTVGWTWHLVSEANCQRRLVG